MLSMAVNMPTNAIIPNAMIRRVSMARSMLALMELKACLMFSARFIVVGCLHSCAMVVHDFVMGYRMSSLWDFYDTKLLKKLMFGFLFD